jgi:hypothetical protein
MLCHLTSVKYKKIVAGNQHTIYTRWSNSGALARVYEELKLEQIVRIRSEAFSLDSRSVKSDSGWHRGVKKGTTSNPQIPRWMGRQDSSGAADA